MGRLFRRRVDRRRDRPCAYGGIDRGDYGVAAFSVEGDTPYCIPLSLVRVGDELFFHCAKQGSKLALLSRNPNVCVSFVSNTQPVYLEKSNSYTTADHRAVVKGHAAEVTDPQPKTAGRFARCTPLTPHDMDGFERAIERSLGITGVWGIHMSEVTGKEKAHM